MTKVQRLSDGKIFLDLYVKRTQPDMFKLSGGNECIRFQHPQTEGIFSCKIANPNQLDDALNKTNAYKKVLGYNWSRSDQIVFYKPGSGKTYDQIGKKIVWIEERLDDNLYQTRQLLAAVLDLSEISKEKVIDSDGKATSLQQAKGMGVIPLSKLTLTKTNEDSKIIAYNVTITSDFDPETDLKVKKVLVQSGWSKVIDSDGYPLQNGKISSSEGRGNENARFLVVRDSVYFSRINYFFNIQHLFTVLKIKLKDLGYVGSIAFCGEAEHSIYTDLYWSFPAAIPLLADQKEATSSLQK